MESQKQERGVKDIKRVTKIIALVSILSFIVSYSSLVSSLQQKLILLSIYSNLVDKKYMFLLCNGIVAFILGNFRGNFETFSHGKAINIVEETKVVDTKDMSASEVEKTKAVLGEKSASEDQDNEEDLQLVVEDDLLQLVVEDDAGIVVQDLAIIQIDDHDSDDEVHDSLLSSEGLNKKFEDFIRKVKAEIRFESRKLITY